MQRSITIKDVAKEAGVAIGTASRVLNGHKSVSDDVRKRVLKAVKKLGYEPDRLAQSMRSGITHTVACAAREIGIAGFSTVVHAAEEVLRDAGYTLLLGVTDERKEREIALLQTISQRRVDALIIATSSESDKDLNRSLTALKMPVILLDRESPSQFDAVLLDHFRGTKMAAEHLLGLGHRRIALITGQPSIRPARERIAGFESALKAAPDSEPIVRTGGFSAEFGFNETSQLLASPEPPTAIIAGGMSMLAGVLQAVRSRGLSIPGDISLIAGADTELAELATPPMTAVRWSGVDQGRVAVQLLLNRLGGNRDTPVQRVLLSTELVKRGSTGPVSLRLARPA